jgi:CTP synthase (UTP-ammonia lyase)
MTGVLCILQALFCQVTPRHVLNMCDVSNIWHVPIMMEAQGAHKSICDILGLGGYTNMNLTGQHLHKTPCRRRLEAAACCP